MSGPVRPTLGAEARLRHAAVRALVAGHWTSNPWNRGTPKADKYKEWNERKSFLGRYIPNAEPRPISPDAFVHESVVKRMHTVSNYQLVNMPAHPQVIPMPSGLTPAETAPAIAVQTPDVRS